MSGDRDAPIGTREGKDIVEQPAWDDPDSSAGTMVRGALWLLQVVGQGGVFTKNQLREAFPGVSPK